LEELLTLVLNLMGTFAFGLSGGILAVKKRMDLFGVLVLSVSTGLGGGIVRDLILGHTPPATLTDWRYLGTAGLAGVLVFVWYNRIANHGTFVTTFDAVGLSIFTVTGTVIALNAGLGPAPAALLGMLTGVGGWRGERCLGRGDSADLSKRSLCCRLDAGSRNNHSC
jgi:uncharacterized membrane protein YeiH